MRYDINLIQQLCSEIGLSARVDTNQRVEVDLGEGAVLCFQNAEREKDCLIGSAGRFEFPAIAPIKTSDIYVEYKATKGNVHTNM